MIIRKAMYGCGLYFFIKLAYNSPILCKFANEKDLSECANNKIKLPKRCKKCKAGNNLLKKIRAYLKK